MDVECYLAKEIAGISETELLSRSILKTGQVTKRIRMVLAVISPFFNSLIILRIGVYTG